MRLSHQPLTMGPLQALQPGCPGRPSKGLHGCGGEAKGQAEVEGVGSRNCPQCDGPGGPQAGINHIHIEDFAKLLRMEERDPQGGQGLPQAREAGGLGKGKVWRRGAWGWICRGGQETRAGSHG